MNKIKCTCGKLAVWILLSGSSFKDDFKCDDCVPRACSCNVYPIDDDQELCLCPECNMVLASKVLEQLALETFLK